MSRTDIDAASLAAYLRQMCGDGSVEWCYEPMQTSVLQDIADMLGRGMLTADDVRDLIERHSDASGGNGRDFHNGAYVAIADELNATMGAGTCHMEPVKDYPVGECAIFSFGCVCSACGSFFEYTRSSNWHFCPHCGRKVVDA